MIVSPTHEGQFLPEETKYSISYIPPTEPFPDEFELLRSTTSLGEYQAVFAHMYRHFDPPGFYYWAMLFWDALTIVTTFFAPGAGGLIRNEDIGD